MEKCYLFHVPPKNDNNKNINKNNNLCSTDRQISGFPFPLLSAIATIRWIRIELKRPRINYRSVIKQIYRKTCYNEKGGVGWANFSTRFPKNNTYFALYCSKHIFSDSIITASWLSIGSLFILT